MSYTDSVPCSIEESGRLTLITGTGGRFPYSIGMLSALEYELKAENYAAAALAAEDENVRLELLRISATFRNKALWIQLGPQAGVLRRCPFTRDQLRPM